MRRAIRSVTGLALSILLPVAAQAQDVTDPPTDVRQDLMGVTLSVMSGELTGDDDLRADTEIGSATGIGGALTYWFSPWAGLRAKAFRTDQRILTTEHPDLLERIRQRSGDVWLLGGDLVLRKPFTTGSTTLLPYLSLGFGVKQYDVEDAFIDRAFNGGAGLEVRLGPVGVFGELTVVASQFEEAGWRQMAREWLYVGGISVSQHGW